jgi:16S rRNA processing protein RimM
MSNIPKKENLRKIGKFLHAHGLRGELFLLIFSGDYSWFEDVSEIYCENPPMDFQKKGKAKVPDVNKALQGSGLKEFKIKSFRPHKDGILVTLAGIDNRNLSDELASQEVWVSDDVFSTDEADDEIFLVEIEGFEVFDQENKIGTIVGFTYNGAQDLLIVSASAADATASGATITTGAAIAAENESAAAAATATATDDTIQFEIPFVEEFIVDINYDEKKLWMRLPEGLVATQFPEPKTFKPAKTPKTTRPAETTRPVERAESTTKETK